MKEMFKSKSILLFIVMMVGLMLFSTPETKLESEQVENEYLSYNLK